MGVDHPILVQAWRESQSIATIWRGTYMLPPNDPRALDATEDEMLYDLLLHHYRSVQQELAAGRGQVSEDVREDLRRSRAQEMTAEAVAARQRFAEAIRRDREPPVTEIRSLRISGKMTPGDPHGRD